MSVFCLSFNLCERLAALNGYFEYSFVRNALIVAVLVALCCSLIGVFLVMKRYSALGDGLSHVAFGAATIAATFGILDFGITLPITVVAAIIILKTRAERRVMGDAVIAMISVGSLAVCAIRATVP